MYGLSPKCTIRKGQKFPVSADRGFSTAIASVWEKDFRGNNTPWI